MKGKSAHLMHQGHGVGLAMLNISKQLGKRVTPPAECRVFPHAPVRRRGDGFSVAAGVLRLGMMVSRYIFVRAVFRLGSLVRCLRGMVGAFLGLPASSAVVARITTVALRIRHAALATLGRSVCT